MAFSDRVLDVLATESSQKALKWLILLALVLFVAMFVLFWYAGPSFSERDVVFELKGPSQALSGDEAIYTLTYKNNTKTTLHNLRLRFFYPDDSIVPQGDEFVQDESSEGLTLDDLSPGDKGEREFKIFLIGDKGDIKTAKVEVLFNAGSLRSAFTKSSAVTTTIVGLPIPLTLAAPPSAVSGQEITYIIDYRNESGTTISDLRFEVSYPDGFAPRQFSPKPAEGNSVWLVPVAKEGAASRITITGTLTGNERETKVINLVLKRKIGSGYVDYERASSTTVIGSPLLNVTMTVNGQSNYAALIGDTLDYAVTFRNNSRSNLIGLNLSVKLEGTMYDFATIQPGEGFFNDSNSTITWTAGALPELSALSPNAGGTARFKVRLKSSLPSGSRTTSVKATATISTTNVPQGIDNSEISAQRSIITRISTQPTLSQVLYYNDPSFSSSGPFPLKVGQETVITIHWQLTNPGNSVTGTVVKGTLPSNVTWKNVTSVGAGQPQIVYNSNTSEVTWNLGTLPFGTGVGTPKYEGTFQVGITPSSTQVGTAPVVIKNVGMSGKDEFTGLDVSSTVRDATTNDFIDRSGEGAVQQ